MSRCPSAENGYANQALLRSCCLELVAILRLIILGAPKVYPHHPPGARGCWGDSFPSSKTPVLRHPTLELMVTLVTQESPTRVWLMSLNKQYKLLSPFSSSGSHPQPREIDFSLAVGAALAKACHHWLCGIKGCGRAAWEGTWTHHSPFRYSFAT